MVYVEFTNLSREMQDLAGQHQKSLRKKAPRPAESLRFSVLSLYRNHFFFVIRSASLADSMRYHQSAASAAFHQGRFAHLPICSAAVSSCLRGFIFGTNRHVILPPIFPNFPYFLKPYLSIITIVPLFVNTFFPQFSTNFSGIPFPLFRALPQRKKLAGTRVPMI